MDLHTELSKIDVAAAARWLLGRNLVHEVKDQTLIGKIVETEAYHQTDPASHTFRGQTERNQVMFGPPGFAYIYFTYGNHYCLNVTAGEIGEGAGILIRALEPLAGFDVMLKNRLAKSVTRTDLASQQLTNGPGKLTQAMGIDSGLYGHDLSQPPLYITGGAVGKSNDIVAATRIGINVAKETPWRFYLRDNRFISRV